MVTPDASEVLQNIRSGDTECNQALLQWAGDAGTLVIPSSQFGAWAGAGQHWNEAVDALSWLRETWPDAALVLLTRDTVECARSMERSWPLWVDESEKGLRARVRQMEIQHHYLMDFSEMNPSTVRLLNFSDLTNPEVLRSTLDIPIPDDAWHAVKQAGKPVEDFPPPPPMLQEEQKDARREEAVTAGMARMRAFESARLGIPPEEVVLWRPSLVKPAPPEQPREKLLSQHVPKDPRPVIELFPGPVDDLPTVSISIMGHPSRLDWVGILLRELGKDTPVSMDDGHGLVENCAKAWELHDPTADYHLVLQDDAILCDDFVAEVRRVLGDLHMPSVVSLFHSSQPPYGQNAKAAADKGATFLWGDVLPGPAICIPTAWIADMLAFYRRHPHRQDDTRITRWLAEKDRKAYFPLPSLVDHRDGLSLAGNGHKGSRPAAVFLKSRRQVPNGLEDGPRAIFYQYLSTAAVWDELKYSLRSVLRFFRDKDCPIYIVGDVAPEWYYPGGRVKFITVDEYRKSPYEGLWKARKIGLQCAEQILQMDDDMYFLRDLGWDEFEEAFSDAQLSGREAGYLTKDRHWLHYMAEASLDLQKMGVELPFYRFSTHTPFLWDRRKMLRILNKFFINHRGSLENLYHNYYKTPRRSPNGWRVTSLPADSGAALLNHTAGGPDNHSRALLREMFPDQAPWEGRVPQIIHQTWKTHDIPRDIYPERWTESWKLHHPEWDYRFWTDADLVRFTAENYPEFNYLIREARGVVKADVGRLLLLYHFGGLYADMDYLCLKPMDELIRGNSAFVSTLSINYTHNALMACCPGYPLMIDAAREALRRWNRDPHGNPEWISGPDLLTQLVKKYRPTHWDQHLVCPIDWRLSPASGLGDVATEKYHDAHAITFWRHNW